LLSAAYTNRFFASLFARLTHWFADATNGIGEMFARVFRAKDALCINDTCVNEDQLKSLLSGQSAAAGASGLVSNAEAPSGSSTPDGTPDADVATTTTPSETVPTETAPSSRMRDLPPPKLAHFIQMPYAFRYWISAGPPAEHC
jgi:hypothetical protein